MRVRLLLSFVLTAFFASQGVAHAQEDPLKDFYRPWSDARSQFNLRKQASCTAEIYPAVVQQMILEELDVPDIWELESGVFKPCAAGALFKDNRISMAQPVYNWVLAEKLILMEGRPAALSNLTGVAPLDREEIAQGIESLPEKAREVLAFRNELLRLDAIGECVARAATEESYDLVFSKANSPEEQERFAKLLPVIESCKNSSLLADPPVFFWRGPITVNLFRLGHALPVGVGVTEAAE